MLIQDVINKLLEPVARVENSVDTLIAGEAQTEVTGIAVAFTASYQVIRQAVRLGANLIITHEGVFYSHREQAEWLETDPVYCEKRRLIEESGVALYRFHDYWHRRRPDGIMEGLIHAFGWQAYIEKNEAAHAVLAIPPMTVGDLAAFIKRRLGTGYVRAMGDLTMPCARIGLLAGYRGSGASAIPLFAKEKLDLIVYGEGPEWETPEYVRDAVQQGGRKALIVLGHAESEEPGMKYLAEWMKEAFPALPVHFIPEHPLFHII